LPRRVSCAHAELRRVPWRLPGQRGVAAASLEILQVRIPSTVTFVVAAIVAVFMLAACGGTGAPAGSSPAPVPSGTPAPQASDSPAASPVPALATLLLKVTTEGGFINPEATLAALPTVAVYADGRIITPGPVDAIAPGPLVFPVLVRDVGPAGAAAILAAIRQAGLDKPSTGSPGIPGDAGTNVFTVVIDGTTTTTRLAGGAPGPGGPISGGGPAGGSADPGRAAALDLLDRLTDPTQTWGAASAPETPFVPAGYRVFVVPGAPASDQTSAPVQWPLATALDAFGTPAVPDRGVTGLRQGVVVGADAAILRPILEAARSSTPFVSGGKTYTLHVRALLPDELGG
jgi:hypothetical protein